MIRETSKMLAARNVKLKNYNNELLPYKIPAKLAGVVMKRMLHSNELTRKIMTLHSNVGDLFYVCDSLYAFGKAHRLPDSLFYANYESVKQQL